MADAISGSPSSRLSFTQHIAIRYASARSVNDTPLWQYGGTHFLWYIVASANCTGLRDATPWQLHLLLGKGVICVAFVCPSVCPSVAYMANNSRTKRPSVPKFGRKVPHLWCDSRTSFKVKRSKVTVTRPINADTHSAPYLPNSNAYEFHTWCTDGGR